MMKTRIAAVVTASLVILVALVTFFIHNQEPVVVFPATVNRDCAPWDGAAFTVKIPLDGGTAIDISIWQSPELKFPVTFSFPDDTGKVGNVILIHPVGLPEQLTGSVSFPRVAEGTPVEGRFDLTTATGERYKGTFTAAWGEEVIFCG